MSKQLRNEPMKIAIVDDEKKQREIIREYIERYGSENNLLFDCREFISGTSALDGYDPQIDMIILDVDMPEKSGIETAKEIREMGSDAVIIFVTNLAQYAINGYEVDAVDYIIKPVGYFDFSMKFAKAIRRIRRSDDKVLALECVDGIHSVKPSKIIYVEIMGHYLIYHGKDREYKLRGSMTEHSSGLLAYGFVRIHKSYLINMKYLDNLKANEVVVRSRDNILLPVGRAYKEPLMKAYLDYLKG